MQQSWRPNRQQQDQASELSVGQQQLREEEQKEDCNIIMLPYVGN